MPWLRWTWLLRTQGVRLVMEFIMDYILYLCWYQYTLFSFSTLPTNLHNEILTKLWKKAPHYKTWQLLYRRNNVSFPSGALYLSESGGTSQQTPDVSGRQGMSHFGQVQNWCPNNVLVTSASLSRICQILTSSSDIRETSWRCQRFGPV